MARRATLSRHWCKIKIKRPKKRRKMKKGQGAFKWETTKLELTGASNNIPCSQHPEDWETALGHSRDGREIWAFVSGKCKALCWLQGSLKNKTAPGQGRVQDLSLDFLTRSKSVMIRCCWSLWMNNLRRRTHFLSPSTGQTVMSVFRNLSSDEPTQTASVLV